LNAETARKERKEGDTRKKRGEREYDQFFGEGRSSTDAIDWRIDLLIKGRRRRGGEKLHEKKRRGEKKKGTAAFGVCATCNLFHLSQRPWKKHRRGKGGGRKGQKSGKKKFGTVTRILKI